MGELLIKVNIADRYYPVKIDEVDEERVREAANMINNRVKAYFEHFSVKDKQDVLAMYALELASENLTYKTALPAEDQRVTDILQRINANLQDIQV